MNLIIPLIVDVWLGILSYYDLKKKEIPHSGWVVIPFGLSCIYRLIAGDWMIVLFVNLVIIASERVWLADQFHLNRLQNIHSWIPPIVLGFWMAARMDPLVSTAILGFWCKIRFKSHSNSGGNRTVIPE
jgi:hypothetical protein